MSKGKLKIHYFRIAAALFLVGIIIYGIIFIIKNFVFQDSQSTNNYINEILTTIETSEYITEPETETEPVSVYPSMSENARLFPVDFDAKCGILIDTESNEIIAYKDYNKRMYPASLTKIMTMIVTVENANSLSDTVPITYEMVGPMYELDASLAGFAVGETPTVEQVLYGVILPSGADAAIAAATYIAGSEDAFVKMMNDKAEEIGLKNTHFTNCVGFHDPNHYSTAEDIAVLMKYALQNETCKKILSTYQYEIPPTEFNPDGITLESTVLGRMNGDEMPGVVIKGGKTGFTDEAGQCLATFAEANGKTYIMVLTGGTSRWNVVYNTLSGYSIMCVGGSAYVPPEVPDYD